MASPPLRLAVLHHYFGPYHLARARHLRGLLGDSVRFLQLATSGQVYEWKAEPGDVTVETAVEGVLEEIPPRMLAACVEKLLARVAPTVVAIAGYADAGMRGAAVWARRHGVRSVMMSDSQHRDRARRLWRERLKRHWVSRHFDAAFVSGAAAAAYAESLGIPGHLIWRGYDVVDNGLFARRAAEARADETRLRAALGLPRDFLLYVGRFVPDKNLHRLIEAFARAADHPALDGWQLVMVGGGVLEAELRRQAAPLGRRIQFCGFQHLDRLPDYYGLAQALILPSVSEPWGLVVNEAMASGLPVIVSRQCGSASDLVFPGVNGTIIDPEDPRDIARAITEMASDRPRRGAFGEASRRIVETFSLETWSKALIGCSLSLQAPRGEPAHG